MPFTLDSYDWAIQELSLSGSIGLGPCHSSTLTRWARVINQRLEAQKANWRVKTDHKTNALNAVICDSKATDKEESES